MPISTKAVVRQPGKTTKVVARQPVQTTKAVARQPVKTTKDVAKQPVQATKAVARQPIKKTYVVAKQPVQTTEAVTRQPAEYSPYQEKDLQCSILMPCIVCTRLLKYINSGHFLCHQMVLLVDDLLHLHQSLFMANFCICRITAVALYAC